MNRWIDWMEGLNSLAKRLWRQDSERNEIRILFVPTESYILLRRIENLPLSSTLCEIRWLVKEINENIEENNNKMEKHSWCIF